MGQSRARCGAPKMQRMAAPGPFPKLCCVRKRTAQRPPDALNAAIDKPVVTEVIGVLRAVHTENKLRSKDKRKGRDDSAMPLAEVCVVPLERNSVVRALESSFAAL